MPHGDCPADPSLPGMDRAWLDPELDCAFSLFTVASRDEKPVDDFNDEKDDVDERAVPTSFSFSGAAVVADEEGALAPEVKEEVVAEVREEEVEKEDEEEVEKEGEEAEKDDEEEVEKEDEGVGEVAVISDAGLVVEVVRAVLLGVLGPAFPAAALSFSFSFFAFVPSASFCPPLSPGLSPGLVLDPPAPPAGENDKEELLEGFEEVENAEAEKEEAKDEVDEEGKREEDCFEEELLPSPGDAAEAKVDEKEDLGNAAVAEEPISLPVEEKREDDEEEVEEKEVEGLENEDDEVEKVEGNEEDEEEKVEEENVEGSVEALDLLAVEPPPDEKRLAELPDNPLLEKVEEKEEEEEEEEDDDDDDDDDEKEEEEKEEGKVEEKEEVEPVPNVLEGALRKGEAAVFPAVPLWSVIERFAFG